MPALPACPSAYRRGLTELGCGGLVLVREHLAEPAKSIRFELPDPLAGEAQLAADLLEAHLLAAGSADAEAELDDAPLPLVEVVECPAEPAGSKFHLTVKMRAYPVRAFTGFYWAYLGPLPAPAIPKLDGLSTCLSKIDASALDDTNLCRCFLIPEPIKLSPRYMTNESLPKKQLATLTA